MDYNGLEFLATTSFQSRCFYFFQFLLTILASASSFMYQRCFPLIHWACSKLRYVSFHFTRNSRLLRMVAMIFFDQMQGPWECYLLFCSIALLFLLSLKGRNREKCHYILFFILEFCWRHPLYTVILAMATLHFVFLLLISPKGFEAEGQRLIPKTAISYEHNFSNWVENPENFRASTIPMWFSNQLSYAVKDGGAGHMWFQITSFNHLLLPIIAQLVKTSKAGHLNPHKVGSHHLWIHSSVG